jgi:hypothetical protein
MRRWLLVLVLLVAGCAGSGTPRAQPSVVTTVVVTHSAIPAPTLVGSPVVFRLADHSVGCLLQPAYAQCDVANPTWNAPAKPGDCFYTWGQQLEFALGTAGAFYCGHPTTNLSATRVLPAGQALMVGLVTCRASGGGVQCDGQGHGFFISRTRYRLM